MTAEKETSATSKPWAEGAQPTPQQALDWLRACTDDEGATALSMLMAAADRASRCFVENHDGRLTQADRLAQDVAGTWQRGYDAGLGDRVHLSSSTPSRADQEADRG